MNGPLTRTVAIFGCILFASEVSRGQGVSLTNGCVINFASVEQAKKLIVAQDDYMQRMQDAERQVRMASANPVTAADFTKSLRAGVRAFTEQEITGLMAVIEDLKSDLDPYELPLPKEINLIRVSKEIEFDAPHCRAASIILPDGFFGPPSKMKMILAHELFHVLSSHNPKLRDRLYGIIGFRKCNEILLPADLKPRRLTNPDAPIHQHVIEVTVDDAKITVAPVTLLRSREFKGGGLQENLYFGLMAVQEKDGEFSARLADGKATLISPMRSADFMKKIGRNTGYIIHPEETLADNFWMMVLKRQGVLDPWVIEKMHEVLKKTEGQPKP